MDVNKILQRPTVAHLWRSIARFNDRLGNQFAGAVTYFSVLSMVPVLMFGFAIAGMILTEIRPDLLTALKNSVVGLLHGAPADVTTTISDVIDKAASGWAGIGLVSAVSLAYAGSRWTRYLKSAIRAQSRPDFHRVAGRSNIVIETLKNLGILLLLLLTMAVTLGIASVATTMIDQVTQWLSLDGVPGSTILTRVVSALISLATGWVLFLFLYRILPHERLPIRPLLIGALMGAIALLLLQYSAGLLVGVFLRNPSAALFGPVIVLLLFFNIFARIILLVAAWIATENQPAIAHKWTPADEPLLARTDVVVADDRHWAEAQVDRRAKEIAKADAKVKRTTVISHVKGAMPGLEVDPAKVEEARQEAVELRLTAAATQGTGDDEAAPGRSPSSDRQDSVPAAVAARRARTHYAVGLLTGSGLGMLTMALAGRLERR